MAVGILTIHCSKNPGASLQAHALCEKVSELNSDVQVINYCPSYFLELMDPERRKSWGVKDKIKAALIGKDLKRKYELDQKFCQEYLPPLTKRYNNSVEIRKDNFSFQTVICGSDQIWNPDNTYCDSTFFFDFLRDPKIVKASYAASIAQDTLTSAQQAFLADNMRNMDYVSIREEQGVQLAKTVCLREDAVQNVDPTLLFSGEYWRRLERKPDCDVPKKYILYYQIHESDLSRELLAVMKKKLNLPCVSPDTGLFKKKNVDVEIRAFGPQEFLWLLDHAEYIITNSFHGTILSLLLGKRVISYKNATRNSRLSSVLKLMDLEMVQVDSIQAALNIDWKNVKEKENLLDERLVPEREKAQQYLKRVIQ